RRWHARVCDRRVRRRKHRRIDARDRGLVTRARRNDQRDDNRKPVTHRQPLAHATGAPSPGDAVMFAEAAPPRKASRGDRILGKNGIEWRARSTRVKAMQLRARRVGLSLWAVVGAAGLAACLAACGDNAAPDETAAVRARRPGVAKVLAGEGATD